MESLAVPEKTTGLPTESLSSGPILLVEQEPWSQTFFGNLGDLFAGREPSPVEVTSPPGEFWPDVFVDRPVPWRRLAESVGCHVAAIALVLGLVHIWPHPIQPTRMAAFDPESVIYYPASEYLPPLDTGKRSAEARKGDPAPAKQPILSVPPEADNHRQTIITPPNVKLDHDVPLPNIVAWGNSNIPMPMAATARTSLNLPTVPVAVVPPSADVSQASSRELPNLNSGIVAPPPEIQANARSRSAQGFTANVVAPPPTVQMAGLRTAGDLNIGASSVVAPAPQLPVAPQRTVPGQALGSGGRGDVVAPAPELSGAGSRRMATTGSGVAGAGKVVPPPPTVAGAGNSGGGRLIALSVAPADVKGPIQVPAGNRRGSFAASPDGKAGASGAPSDTHGSPSGSGGRGGGGDASGTGGSGAHNLPSGIYVGGANTAATGSVAGQPRSGQFSTVNPTLLASAGPPPRVTATANVHGAAPVDDAHATRTDRQVFGSRQFYSMSLNMPNLNSAGGSWIIRFAELRPNGPQGDLIAPVATQKVDPGYPIELMRQNVSGNVTLRAVIRSDGTVGDVTVLNSVDDRLDDYARSALSHWRFQPATKNGSAVDLEAVVTIPFHTGRPGF
jgi:TonB family protein